MSAVMFKPGDKVCVRTDLEPGEIYGGWNTTDDMAESGGKILTIRKIDKGLAETNGAAYRVMESPWGWTDEMLEPYLLAAKNCERNEDTCDIAENNIDIGDLMKLYKG